jgi:hypothetical protein
MDPIVTGLIVAMVAVIAIVLTFAARLEWLMILAIVTIMFADTTLFPSETDSAVYFYARFVPLGLVAIRALMSIRARGGGVRSLPGLFLKPFGLLFLLSAFGTIYSEHPLNNGLRAVSMLLVLISFGIGIPACMPEDKQLRRGIRTVVLLLGGVILVSLVTYPFIDSSSLEMGEYERVSGLFKNPNTLGLLSMLTFFPLAAMWWEDRRRRWLGFLSIAVLFGVLLSGSRGSFVGLLSGFLVVTILRGLDSKLKAAILAVIVLGVVSIVLMPQFQGLARTDNGGRLVLWERAWQLGMRAPMTGVTLGGVDGLFDADREYFNSMHIYVAGSHDEYLRLFVALGFPGVLIALFGLFSITVSAIRSIPGDIDQMIQVSLLASVVAGMVNAIFEDWLFAFGGAPSLIFFFFLAVLSVYVHRRYLRRQVGAGAVARQPVPAYRPVAVYNAGR